MIFGSKTIPQRSKRNGDTQPKHHEIFWHCKHCVGVYVGMRDALKPTNATGRKSVDVEGGSGSGAAWGGYFYGVAWDAAHVF